MGDGKQAFRGRVTSGFVCWGGCGGGGCGVILLSVWGKQYLTVFCPYGELRDTLLKQETLKGRIVYQVKVKGSERGKTITLFTHVDSAWVIFNIKVYI